MYGIFFVILGAYIIWRTSIAFRETHEIEIKILEGIKILYQRNTAKEIDEKEMQARIACLMTYDPGVLLPAHIALSLVFKDAKFLYKEINKIVGKDIV